MPEFHAKLMIDDDAAQRLTKKEFIMSLAEELGGIRDGLWTAATDWRLAEIDDA